MIADARPNRYAWYVLAVLTLTYTCSFIDRYVLFVLMEPIKAELQVSDTMMGLLGGFSFALLYTTAGLPIARWADRGSRRDIIAIGIALWSAMTVACGMARSFTQLFITRVGVGLGEAACTPPAHSLLGDYFPRTHRATALSIYTMGGPIGMVLGFLGGGWLAYWFDWRTAFVLVGAPGLLLALLVRLTVREPIRGLQDQAFSPKAEPASMISALKQLLSQPLFSCIQLGGACYSLWGYGMSLWVAPFFARTHQLPIEYLASWLAAGAFFGGISGAWLSGRLADRLGREKLSGYLLIPIVGTLLGVLATAVMLQASSWKLGMAMFLVQQLCSSFYAGPVYALMQMTVPVQLRAQAVAVHLFVVNVVGLGAGPLLIGWLSDLYTPSLGAAQALTNGLLLVSCGGLLMIVIFAIGMRMLREGALVLNSKATSI